MSLFIDQVETLNFHTITSLEYSEKINGLLNRFPKLKKDTRYRTVLAQKFLKRGDDYISMKFCTRGRVPIYGIYTKMDLSLVAVCVQGTVFALDPTDFHASFVPDLKFRTLSLGIQHTPLAVTQTVSYVKETMCCAISTLSLGYTPQEKFEWCNAIMILSGITTQAARFTEVKSHIGTGLNTEIIGRAGLYLDSTVLGAISRWNKISKAIRSGECPYAFTTYVQYDRSIKPKPRATTVCGDSTDLTLSLINDKDRTKREKFRRVKNKWDEKRKRKKIKRKRQEKRRRKHDIRLQKGDFNMSILKKMTNNKILWESIKALHGFWYGSVDTLQYEVSSPKSLLRPTQIVTENRFLVSAVAPLYQLKVVLQTQTTCASNFLAVKSIWNGSLLAFSREGRPFVQLGCGRAEAIGATCIPLQVITTRMQTHYFTAYAGSSGMLDVFRRTLQHESLRGFCKELVPHILTVASSGRAATKLKASILAVFRNPLRSSHRTIEKL